MSFIQTILEYNLWQNSGKAYATAVALFLGLVIFFSGFQVLVLGKIGKKAKATRTEIDDFVVQIIGHINPPFYFILSLYLAVQTLTLSEKAHKIIYALFIIIVVYQSISIAQKVIDYTIYKFVLRTTAEKGKETAKMFGAITKAVLWVLGVMLVLSNLGFNINSLIAGLGISGIAIALAAQNVLIDLFSSFTIIADKPFRLGDLISVGDEIGTVKKIGWKTTRIQTLQGDELIFANRDITLARVHNYRRMDKRKIYFVVSVGLPRRVEQLRRIPSVVQNIFKKVKYAKLERVHFKEYGPNGANFEIVYGVATADFTTFMNVQQEINIAMLELFAMEGIKITNISQGAPIPKGK